MSVITALSVLSLAASASVMRSNTSQVVRVNSSQALNSLLWMKPDSSCFENEESCRGTDVWCSTRQFYHDIDGYESQAACFAARLGKTPWRYINSDCIAYHETCDGTDAVCSRVEDAAIRDHCYASRSEGEWLPKYASGCLAAGMDDDERCMGTEDFCRAEARIKSYGSTEKCLAYREKAPEKIKKPEFLVENPLRCFGDATEECRGTEKFCFNKPHQGNGNKDVLDCIESRINPLLYAPDSPDCTDFGFSEACVGTSVWCANKKRVKIYGTKERCEDLREPASDEPSRWFAPGQECRDEADQSERCIGTERKCQLFSSAPDDCFRRRETAPFLLAKPSGECSQAESKAESCQGTDRWCHERYQENNYRSEGECFSRRGFKHDEMVAAVVKNMSDLMTDIILKQGAKVVENAVHYDLVGNGGDEKSAKQSIATYLDRYLEELEKTTLPSATESYMAKLRKAHHSR
ncbi:hypothetical protein CP533_6937 [Ophiocordyceps camponoti-saundersi (nom. inval.)]|nr:hypothetical protein CP533_6937 [Ophiocordyceps camponoti-saundersi (nom. inval.)]